MNPSLLSVSEILHSLRIRLLLPQYRRLLLPIILLLLLFQSQTREIVLPVLSEAFWQVSIFVAFTLSIYHLFADKISHLYVDSQGNTSVVKEIITACLMGGLPGCGGAIVVITQYVSGRMSFGAVVAVLTSTMGDAAFLLLATEPVTGLGVFTLCLCVGIVSGLVVNRLHGYDFLRSSIRAKNSGMSACKVTPKSPSKRLIFQGLLWKWLMIPGVIVGLMMAAQVNVSSLLNFSDFLIEIIGASITVIFIVLWSLTREVTNFESIVSEDKKTKKSKAFQKVALDTNFVTAWVVVAFLLFEFAVVFGELELDMLFTLFGAGAPLMGVVIGMIPGCGPQIITTSLYLSGAIPLSAQIGNAISNDGDALFPAIALSPKVAVVATLYSSIPALITAYSYYWLFEI